MNAPRDPGKLIARLSAILAVRLFASADTLVIAAHLPVATVGVGIEESERSAGNSMSGNGKLQDDVPPVQPETG